MIRQALTLLRPFWPIALASTAMGCLSGAATAALLATTNKALHGEGGVTLALLLTFGGLCALTLAGEVISDIGNSLVGQRVVEGLRRDLSAKILAAPIDEIERFKTHRLITALNQDIDTISGFTFTFSSLAIALAVTLGCLGYMFVLSPLLFGVALTAIVIGSAVHGIARREGIKSFRAAREAQDELQKHYRAITEGAKELRVNRARRHRIFADRLVGAIGRIRELRMRATRIFCSANAFGSALFFIIIGLMLVLQGQAAVDSAVISGFVLVLLYIKGPIEQLVGALPMVAQAQISMRHIAELSQKFSTAEPFLVEGDTLPAPRQIERIELNQVRYAFPAAGTAQPFVLGPIDLTIARNEILFIVGENGCGKTTLIKLLLGLYAPQSGQVLLDDRPVEAEQRDDYRQIFTAIFSDYYLFDDLLYAPGPVSGEIQGYLERLEIAHKVEVRDGVFTTTDLSTGQRKRLALIHAWLEQRPVLVLDEWAADQDPTFRRIFYREILPALKAQDRTLIVISHDDRYFDAADRVIRLQAGQVVEDWRPAASVDQAGDGERGIDGDLRRRERQA